MPDRIITRDYVDEITEEFGRKDRIIERVSIDWGEKLGVTQCAVMIPAEVTIEQVNAAIRHNVSRAVKIIAPEYKLADPV